MKLLVDTTVWSLSLRRDHNKLNFDERVIVDYLEKVVVRGMVHIIGPIKQEILSGIKITGLFENISRAISVFDDVPIRSDHYIKAAEFYNRCSSKGVIGSSVDLLICAVAYSYDFEILTCDNDFKNFSKILPIKLHEVKLPIKH